MNRPVHLVHRADAGELLSAVERWRASTLYAIPTVWERILADGAAYDASSLREVLTGTSRVDLDLVDALKARFPGTWTSVAYGSTEIGHGAVLTDADLYLKPLSVGLPPPAVEARIDADDELLQRGPTMFSGYLDRPDATADAIDADGWYHTGDLATCDADGYLTITGRRSEGIRSGGEWIAPVEVEAAVLTHPAVAEVGVVGTSRSPLGRAGVRGDRRAARRDGADGRGAPRARRHTSGRGQASTRRRRRRAVSPTPTPPVRSAAPHCAPRSSPTARMRPGSSTSAVSTGVIAARLAAQLLSGPPARTPDAVVQRLLAVQAQDPRGARLAVRSRSVGLHATDVDDALNDGRLVITWLNRGTLHLVDAEDYWWLHPLTTPQLETGNRRRLRRRGRQRAASRARGRRRRRGGAIARATDARRAAGAARRRGSPDRRAGARARAPGGERSAATSSAARCAAPSTSSSSVADWLGEAPEPLERPDALARLARRYLAGHGPADAPDLARWAGMTLGDARDRLRRHRGRGGGDGPEGSSISPTVTKRPACPARGCSARSTRCCSGGSPRDPLVGAHQGIVTIERTVPRLRARRTATSSRPGV